MKMTEPYDEQEKCNAYDPAQKAEKGLRKEHRSGKWDIKGKQGYALYEWWLRKVGEVKGGYGANFLVCMAIYACKCDVPREKLEQDLRGMCENLSTLEYDRRLTEADIQHALETYDKGNYKCTIAEIEKLSGIHIERSKRNGRNIKEHLHGEVWIENGRRKVNICKANRELRLQKMRENGEIPGRPSVEHVVREYMKTHPTARKVDVIRGTGLSKQTVYKYYDALRQELWPETGMDGQEH